jgi:hypothetical protein
MSADGDQRSPAVREALAALERRVQIALRVRAEDAAYIASLRSDALRLLASVENVGAAQVSMHLKLSHFLLTRVRT